MSSLIAQSDVRKVRKLFQAYPNDEFDSFMLEIERFYLMPLIGVELYEDLAANPDAINPPYVSLRFGLYYTYSDTKYYLQGVKKYLSYLFFYKLSIEGGVKYTESGRQNFDVDFANRPNKGIDAQVINNFLSKSQVIGKEIQDYLDRNSSSFPLYKSTKTSNKPNESFRFRVMGNTYKGWKAND